ncbi:MAG TPA: response regulator [Polyangiaceae bacterium]|nr:response regulator [Polyangiaceae bacterium]
MSIRAKLILIVGTAAAAFLFVMLGGIVIAATQVRYLSDVEGRLVPKLEMGPKLEAEFERLRQELQNAVAAQDLKALEETSALKDELIQGLASAGTAVDPADGARLRWALNGYYAVASDVSRRLIRGEAGDEVLAAVAKMQAEQQKTLALLQHATRLDRHELTAGFAAVRRASDSARRFYIVIGTGALVLLIVLSFWLGQGMLRSVRQLSSGFERFGRGDFDAPIVVITRDELGRVASEANQMADSLRLHAKERDRRDWIRAGQAELSDELRGTFHPDEAARRVVTFLVRRIGALAGAIYVLGDDAILRLRSHHGLTPEDEAHLFASFRIGEGLVGRAAATNELLVVDDPPPNYLRIRSGLGEASPRAVVLVPLARLGKVVAIVELALFEPCSEAGLELLTSIREIVAITLAASQGRAELEELLEETRQQAERLTAQEEELRHNNQELKVQQTGLKSANRELEEQRRELSHKNGELEEARLRVQQKADELSRVSSYKSQFLANMSHELRTPLNSMLLLSHLLAENESKTLSAKQVEHCKTIHAAGQDLLGLINQVLDLAKIEAGKHEVLLESIELGEFTAYAKRVFEALASEKGLKLVLEIEEGLPRAVTTDQQRVERILTNLLGNAIKFTEKGEVRLRIQRPRKGTRFERDDLSLDKAIAFVVSDTGIGIAPESHERVFAPFEQVESQTHRRYGGTGLGLAIARESAGLLGGELRLESEAGRGSTFTCYLPERDDARHVPARSASSETSRQALADDRHSIAVEEPYLLVIEDDVVIAEQLVDIIRARRLKVVVAGTGQEGLRLARERRPIGIILDVRLPDVDGWTVMERLSQDPTTGSAPVHFISAVDTPERGLSLGALGYLTKPASRAQLAEMVRTLAPRSDAAQTVLVVEDSAVEGELIVEFLRKENYDSRHVQSATAALSAIEAERFSCMILDLGLPDMDGLGLLETLRKRPEIEAPRVIVHTGRALTKVETRELEAYAEAIVLKGGHSEARLVEEIRLFVHHVKETLPQGQPPSPPERRDVSFVGRKILIAEDDMRTVYALSALLQAKGAEVLVADNGREALDLLSVNPDVDGVLMDIMMPEMDGYQAMTRLRQDKRFALLPVVALTARAMKGERERCLEAGATEYLTKPVDSEQLLLTLATIFQPQGSNGSRRLG